MDGGGSLAPQRAGRASLSGAVEGRVHELLLCSSALAGSSSEALLGRGGSRDPSARALGGGGVRERRWGPLTLQALLKGFSHHGLKVFLAGFSDVAGGSRGGAWLDEFARPWLICWARKAATSGDKGCPTKTLHPKPENPKPYTWNPIAYTLNPMHPKP